MSKYLVKYDRMMEVYEIYDMTSVQFKGSTKVRIAQLSNEEMDNLIDAMILMSTINLGIIK